MSFALRAEWSRSTTATGASITPIWVKRMLKMRAVRNAAMKQSLWYGMKWPLIIALISS